MSLTRRVVMDGWLQGQRLLSRRPLKPVSLKKVGHIPVSRGGTCRNSRHKKQHPHYNYSTLANGSSTPLSYDLPHQEENIIKV